MKLFLNSFMLCIFVLFINNIGIATADRWPVSPCKAPTDNCFNWCDDQEQATAIERCDALENGGCWFGPLPGEICKCRCYTDIQGECTLQQIKGAPKDQCAISNLDTIQDNTFHRVAGKVAWEVLFTGIGSLPVVGEVSGIFKSVFDTVHSSNDWENTLISDINDKLNELKECMDSMISDLKSSLYQDDIETIINAYKDSVIDKFGETKKTNILAVFRDATSRIKTIFVDDKQHLYNYQQYESLLPVFTAIVPIYATLAAEDLLVYKSRNDDANWAADRENAYETFSIMREWIIRARDSIASSLTPPKEQPVQLPSKLVLGTTRESRTFNPRMITSNERSTECGYNLGQRWIKYSNSDYWFNTVLITWINWRNTKRNEIIGEVFEWKQEFNARYINQIGVYMAPLRTTKSDFISALIATQFKLTPKNVDECVSDPSLKYNADDIGGYSCTDGWNDQFWQIVDYDGSKYFRIKNQFTNKYMIEKDGNVAPFLPPSASYPKHPDQWWSIHSQTTENGITYYRLQNKLTGNFLFLNQDGVVGGYNDPSDNDQLFRFIISSEIKTAWNGLCLQGNTVEACDGGEDQNWRYEIGTGRIVRSSDGKCLDVHEGKNENGQNVQIGDCHEGPAQTWELQNDGTIKFAGVTDGRCLDIDKTNNNMILYDCWASINQVWYGTWLPNSGSTHHSEIKTAWNGGKCLQGNSVEACDGTKDQQWRYEVTKKRIVQYPQKDAKSDGIIPITCLSVNDGKNENGQNVEVRACSIDDSQKWEPQDDGTIKFAGVANGKCLDIDAGNNGNNGNMILYDCGDSKINQVWYGIWLPKGPNVPS